MSGIRYELDPYNRLVETRIGRRGAVIGMRRVLEGSFRLSPGTGELVYRLKEPLPQGKGSSLREIRLNARIIDAKADSLVFSVAAKDEGGSASLSILTLDGVWQADFRNRLTFAVRRAGTGADRLVFEGAWELDKRLRVVYRSGKGAGFSLEGAWELGSSTRISYVLGTGTDSRLDFRAAASRFAGRTIRYEVGIGIASRKRPVRRQIEFTGKWQVTPGIGLEFVVAGPGSVRRSFTFGCRVRLTARDTLACALRSSDGRALGAEIELERRVFKGDGRVFLRLLEERGVASVTIGAGWAW